MDREKLAGLTAGYLIMVCSVLVLGIWLEIERYKKKINHQNHGKNEIKKNVLIV